MMPDCPGKSERMTEEEQGYLDELKRLTHVDMARLWRFAPAGHHFFGGNAVATEAFMREWYALGGMTTKISKTIGWDENQADNRRVIDGD